LNGVNRAAAISTDLVIVHARLLARSDVASPRQQLINITITVRTP
jgi:hypothetical protein